MKKLQMLFTACIGLALSSCGGSGYQPSLIPGMSGQWEFIASSTQNLGQQTAVEASVKQGRALMNGVYQPTSQISASGSQQITVLSQDPAGDITFGGTCAGAGISSLTGTVDPNYNVTINYSENGNLFSVTGTLSSDHKSILGTYSSQAGNPCVDSGTFTGLIVPKLSGMYVGQLCQPTDNLCQFPQGAADAATATLSQSGSTVSVNMVVTGADNTSFTLTGPVTANAFTVQGNFNANGQVLPVTYNGYYELTFNCVTQQIDLPSVYLVNPANIGGSNPFGQVALLTVPQTQICPGN